MLTIAIVEDDAQLATTIRYLVELNPRFKVTAVAHDLASALQAVGNKLPDVALVDLQLANSTSGYSVAAKLHDLGVMCLFMTGSVPSFPLPDLAVGCLAKPFREEDLVRALDEVEGILRGRKKVVLRPSLPEQLQIYSPGAEELPASTWRFRPRSGGSLRARLWKLVRRPSHFRSALPQ